MSGVERYQRKMRSLQGCPAADKAVMKISVAGYVPSVLVVYTYRGQQGGFEACKVSQKNPEIKTKRQ